MNDQQTTNEAVVDTAAWHDVRLEIDTQGAPRINVGYVYRENKDIVALAIDLHSKRCEVFSTGLDGDVPIIFIGATTDSLYLNKAKDIDSITAIRLPEYVGWSIWSADITKYTLAVCLVKNVPN